MRALVCVVLALFLSGPALADLTGIPRVIDGDTIVISGTHIRLVGIDAPEMRQICWRGDGRAWACGLAAKDRLAAKIGGQPVTCEDQGLDRYGRTLGRCRLGDIDLQAWLVREGLAVSFRRYSHAYDRDEENAKFARIGLWSGGFDLPADWRRDHH
jgi:endonuclease YncB( thermonuclease family)